MMLAETRIIGAFVIEAVPQPDERGYFARIFSRRDFGSRGLESVIEQASVSFNLRAGTLRGLHYRRPGADEARIVRCTAGRIFDVIVDLRAGSPSFRTWAGSELSRENLRAIYVPRGVCHGFLTLEDASDVTYYMSAPYDAASERGIRWDDPDIRIDWPFQPMLMSARDAALPFLKDVPVEDLPEASPQ